MKIMVFGLSVGSSWGNGHGTLWRGLLAALAAKGHRIEPAAMSPHKPFLVCGAQFPEATQWPVNVRRFEHAEPGEHAALYSSSRFTLNITRREMVWFGYCPSGRLFEAIGSGNAKRLPAGDAPPRCARMHGAGVLRTSPAAKRCVTYTKYS